MAYEFLVQTETSSLGESKHILIVWELDADNTRDSIRTLISGISDLEIYALKALLNRCFY